MTIRPTERLQRVTVLINRLANQRKSNGLFEKNALPLLKLAGIEVNIIKVNLLIFYYLMHIIKQSIEDFNFL